MRVPSAVVHFDESHALLGEATRHEALARKRVVAATDAVHLERLRLLAGQVHEVRHLGLHAERQLVALDDALDLVLAAVAHEARAVQLLHQVELLALRIRGELRVPQVRHSAVAAVAARAALKAHAGALVDGGKEAGTVVLRAAVTRRRIERDEPRQVLVFGAQAVQRPRTQRRTHELEAPGVHQDACLRVGRHGGVHAAQQAQAVGVFGDAGHDLADHEAALARAVELERAGQQLRARTRAAQRLAGVGRQARLVVERVDVARAARHAEEDDALRARLEVRGLRRERIALVFVPAERARLRLVGDAREGEQAEAARKRLQRVAPGPTGEAVVAQAHGILLVTPPSGTRRPA